ncbi:MAG: ABC transporter permease [Anaerolineae bacterium]|nr:ABC transporter permease [Anaerolineae bacterium]
MSESTTAPAYTPARGLSVVGILERFGVALALVVLMLVLTILSPEYFLTPDNLTNVANRIAFVALISLGEFLVILTAGIDLSVGSVMGLSLIMLAKSCHFLYEWYAGWYATASMAASLPEPASPLALGIISLLSILIALGTGYLCGLLNGWGFTKLGLPHPFIMTLGMLNIARGAANLISRGSPITGLPRAIRVFGAGNIILGRTSTTAGLRIPIAFIVVLALYFLFWVFLTHTKTGRHIYAVGGNPQATLYAGVNVKRILNLVYILSGMLAAVAGLLYAGRINSGTPKAAMAGYELDAIASVIIGGASFFGGRGTVVGTLIGVLIMGFIRNGLNLLNVSVFWQEVAIGVIIISAAFIDVLRRRAARQE